MTVDAAVLMGTGMAVLAFLWSLRKDVSEIRGRLARVEDVLAEAGLKPAKDQS